MKCILLGMVAVVATTLTADDLKLKNGKVLHDAELQGIDSKGLSFYYDKQTKVTTVLPDQLSEADLKKYQFALEEYTKKKEKLIKDIAKQKHLALLGKIRTYFNGTVFQMLNDGGLAQMNNPYTIIISHYLLDNSTPDLLLKAEKFLTQEEKRVYSKATIREIDQMRGAKLAAVENARAEHRRNYQSSIYNGLPAHRVTIKAESPSSGSDPSVLENTAKTTVLRRIFTEKAAQWNTQHQRSDQIIKIDDLPAGMIDGSKWEGKIYLMGTYRYHSRDNVMCTIPRYTTNARKALEYYESSSNTKLIAK